MFALEAGVALPGEASFQFELGVRGRTLIERATWLERNFAQRSIAVTGGARGRLSIFPIELGLVPVLGGGLSIGSTRDQIFRGTVRDRVSVGPHLALGVEKTLPWMTVSLLFDGRAEIVPAGVEVGAVLEIRLP